jgi:hypothetical protein
MFKMFKVAAIKRFSCAVRGCEMPYAWYVTFEVHERGTLQRRRSPRATKTFETEKEAREFARAKFNEGLIVHAGTLNPHLPRRTIPSSEVPGWLDDQREEDPANARGSDRKDPG